MPLDKLVLITKRLKPKIKRLIRKEKHPGGYYAYSLDLRETYLKLPVIVSIDGRYNNMSKIEFVQVAKLGLSRTKEILKILCGNDWSNLKIYRIDWAVDVLAMDARQLAECCRVRDVQKSMFFHSRSGDSFYLQFSKIKKIVIYDKDEQIARFEVQFCGRGVPITEFINIRHYANINILEKVFFDRVPRIRQNLKPEHRLIAVGMLSLVRKFGLHTAIKTFRRFSPSQWEYWFKKLFQPKDDPPDVKSLMQKSMRDWLEDRIRFPRVLLRK